MLIPSHMAWGYVLGKLTSRYLGTRPNIGLLILAGGLVDYDLFTRQPYGTILGHHGISHSWLALALLSVPFLFTFRKQAVAYVVAALQHPVFGDLITNKIPLLFPLTLTEYGFNVTNRYPTAGIALEITGFLIFMTLFFVSGEWKTLQRPKRWDRLCIPLWAPLLALTTFQALIYYKPGLITAIYSAYALVSSISLLAIGALIAARGNLWD